MPHALKRVSLITYFIIYYWIGNLAAQQIKVGEKVPNVILENVINYKNPEIKLTDLKGKLIVLDFWTLTCSACIHAFQKMDSLQKEFNSKIQIILVNHESKKETISFFAKRNKIKIPSLPFVTQDSILNVFFPQNYYPWHVWIDSNHIVRSISDGYNTTPENIQSLLAGTEKKVAQLDYIPNVTNQPLIIEGNGRWFDSLKYYSYILHCIPGVTVHNFMTETHISANCSPILSLFITAFEEKRKYDFKPANAIVLNVKDPEKFRTPLKMSDYDHWIRNNSYDYDLVIPVERSNEIFHFMQEDLKNYFNITATIQKRKIKSLVLTMRKGIDRLASKGGKKETNIWIETDDPLIIIRNLPFKVLLEKIRACIDADGISTPFIDQSDYAKDIDIDIDKRAFSPKINLELLKSELLKYNLQLEEKEVVTDVLVMEDR